MHTEPRTTVTGKWVNARTYAEVFGLHVQTLANWRSRDKKEGLTQARPGCPVYRRFSTTVRYLLEPPEPTA
jgi:hypothetical protein